VIGLLRRFAIRSVLKVRWRMQPHSLASTLGRFSEVEADSAWHFARAADFLQLPKHRAAMLATALEETHHAFLFKKIASRAGARHGNSGLARKTLVASSADIPGFLAYSHISEGLVHGEFTEIAAASGDPAVAQVLAEIGADESGHEDGASQMLNEIVPRETLRRAVRKARWRRRWDDWMFVAHAIGKLNAALWLSLIYLILGGFAAPLCRQRLRRKGATGQPETAGTRAAAAQSLQYAGRQGSGRAN
jgi:rubrerythrin